MSKPLKTLKGKKVKNVMIMLQFEDGTGCVARPGEIGKVEGLQTLNDMLKLMSHDGDEDLPPFQSPVVFAMDIRQAAREWVEEFQNEIKEKSKPKNFEPLSCATAKLKIDWIKHFFNLGDEDER